MLVSFAIHILAILLTLSLLICAHELGHYIFARLANVQVIRFSLGFGKPLWTKRFPSGMELVVAAIPLGGYVKMLDEREANVSAEEVGRAYNRQTYIKRVAIIAAGPFANFILALLLFWSAYVMGIVHIKPIIAETSANSLTAHLPKEALITRVNDKPVHSWLEISVELLMQLGSHKKLTMQLQKSDSELLTYPINLTHWQLDPIEPNIINSLGIFPKLPSRADLKKSPERFIEKERYSILAAGIHAWQKMVTNLRFNSVMIYKILTGVISYKSLGGPVTLLQGINLAVKASFANYLIIIGMLSIAIGFVNLLPIPGLDGGHLLLLAIEKIRGKALSIAAQVLAFRLGMIVLALIMVQALTNDLVRLLG